MLESRWTDVRSGACAAAAGDAQWQQRVAGRLQQLRCVARAVATFGGRQAVSAGEAEQDPLLHAMAATKKHLDAIDTDVVRTEDDLARTRHKLQVRLRTHIAIFCIACLPTVISIH